MKKYTDIDTVIGFGEGVFIPKHEGNADYKRFVTDLENSDTPEDVLEIQSNNRDFNKFKALCKGKKVK